MRTLHIVILAVALVGLTTGCGDTVSSSSDRSLEGGAPSPSVSANDVLSPSQRAANLAPSGGANIPGPATGTGSPSPGAGGTGVPVGTSGGCGFGDIDCVCDSILAAAGTCGFADFLEDDFFAECYDTDVGNIERECGEEGLTSQQCWDTLVAVPLACLSDSCDFFACFEMRGQEPTPVGDNPRPPGDREQ